MEKNIEVYNKKEKCNIKAKLFYENLSNKSTRVFIFCHGFCSGKGSNSVKVVANMLLECGIPSISFDFPGHMDSVQGTDKLKVDICISYINSVIDYVKEKYGEDIKISFYGISFGAYILLNKLIGDVSNYENIILRSPAINMKDILVDSLLKESFEQYKKGGKAKAGHGGKLEVPYSFYEDLVSHNLYDNYKEKRKILIIQGALDDTAPIEDTYKFIQNKSEIEFIEMKDMKHHMEAEEILRTTEVILKKLRIERLK
jgi:alpha/beta superfamily hydrolase